MNKKFFILCFALLTVFSASAQKAMNRPYADDKLFHFGFSLGVNFMDYAIKTAEEPMTGKLGLHPNGYEELANTVINARCSYMIPGFSVGFIGDLRLCDHLNLRLIPQLHFGERDITYQWETKDEQGEAVDNRRKTSIVAIPIAIPLELKWSADRCGNYRPFVTVGGGVSYNCFENKEKPILPERLDYFAEIGAGCDVYFSWFKFCPQLKYQLGFNDLTPATPGDYLNSQVVKRMRSHMISLIFNFE